MVSTQVGALDGDDAPSPLEALFAANFRNLARMINVPVPYWRYAPGVETAFSRYVAAGRRTVDIVAPIVADRRAAARAAGAAFEPRCFVDVLVAAGDAADPPLRDAEVVRHSGQILAAGYDTTSNTLSFASLLLAARPDVQSALRAEVRAAAPAGPLAPAAFPATPLLTAVIKETMRLYPAAPLFGRRYVGAEPFAHGADAWAAGTQAYVSPYLLGRNRGVWGDDVLDFRPDRFANGKRAGDATHSYAWLPFGYGDRGCVGMHLAMTEAKLILGNVVRDFRLDLADHQSPTPDPALHITLSNAGGVHLRLTALPH